MSTKSYYERYWSSDGFNPRDSLPRGLQQLFETHIPTSARCLDVGCGPGLKVGLWMQNRGNEYVGVDISENAVQEAQKLGLDARTIEDAASLPFCDASFDAVTCIEVLEHLFQPQVATAEMFRVLKPGGVLIATVPNVAYWRRRGEIALLGQWNPIGDGLSIKQPWRDPHLRFFSKGALRRMVEQAGFANVRVGGHEGGYLRSKPIRRWFGEHDSPRIYRVLERMMPSLFGLRLNVVAQKP